MSYADVTLRVLFLIAITVIGFFTGRKLAVNPREISVLLMYIISPAVIIVAVLEAPSNQNYFIFTAGAFVVCSVMATLALLVGRALWSDSTKNLFAFSGGTGNTGYFGLPVAYGLFGDLGAAVAVFIIIGVNLYEFSYGYYLNSLGTISMRDSLLKIVKLPVMYAFVAALIIRELPVSPNDVVLLNLQNFKGAYSVLGMMVIGITLAKFGTFKLDYKYLLSALTWKFLAWPAFCLILIKVFEPYISVTEQAVIMLMAAVPMAGNTVVIANELDVHPGKAATAVMASTVMALLTVPITLTLV